MRLHLDLLAKDIKGLLLDLIMERLVSLLTLYMSVATARSRKNAALPLLELRRRHFRGVPLSALTTISWRGWGRKATTLFHSDVVAVDRFVRGGAI